ncbi:MAG: aspartate aminotransferase family protein [Candidatus Abyssobacteria bacterium SURF_17]|jgi:adenosylmethionine-8-amino-7-oxononanoate aminotransferase|uniref:Aspartate aminotransferase family protein n=1 Tax=Candidatus Abyssobacteria bacterium SURF_17 TaxID=2093361 RepID=A0A419ES37_9BACT|nr:MAG: aspartate aminotransferase family protein [Candidatus Abyssubacteria bacterium SURF_17]
MQMRSKEELSQMDVKYLVHPAVNFKEHRKKGPRIIVEGKGTRVKDIDGNEYLDAFSSLWNVVAGHGQEAIGKAITEQLSQLEFYSGWFGFATESAIELAAKVVNLMPKEWNMGHVLFTCGGSDTNDTNIKLARMYWELKGQEKKKKIISRNFAFHGVTYGSMMATGIEFFKTYFEPYPPGFLYVAPPYCYRCALGLAYPECGVACAKTLEEAILQEGPDTVAAFIGEPVMGAGGIIIPPDEYWPMIQKICDTYDVLFINDEVITGFGRTGKMFGCMNWDVHPDLVSIAKGLTSGYLPLGGSIMSNKVFDSIAENLPDYLTFLHGFTYNNHPVSCAAGLAALKIIEEQKLVENVAKMGAYLKDRLKGLYDHRSVGDIRSIGLMAAVEFVKDKETKEPLGDLPMESPRRIEALMWERGIYARAIPTESIALAPPFTISKEEIDMVVDALDSSIAQMESEMLH